jgi:hypothetical protein
MAQGHISLSIVGSHRPLWGPVGLDDHLHGTRRSNKAARDATNATTYANDAITTYVYVDASICNSLTSILLFARFSK